LEAEKYLAELEDDEADLKKNKAINKGEVNGDKVPGYWSNPLL
jgi:hypothetical protein